MESSWHSIRNSILLESSGILTFSLPNLLKYSSGFYWNPAETGGGHERPPSGHGTWITNAAPTTHKTMCHASEMPSTNHKSPMPPSNPYIMPSDTHLCQPCYLNHQCGPYRLRNHVPCIWNASHRPQIANNASATPKSTYHTFEHPPLLAMGLEIANTAAGTLKLAHCAFTLLNVTQIHSIDMPTKWVVINV